MTKETWFPRRARTNRSLSYSARQMSWIISAWHKLHKTLFHSIMKLAWWTLAVTKNQLAGVTHRTKALLINCQRLQSINTIARCASSMTTSSWSAESPSALIVIRKIQLIIASWHRRRTLWRHIRPCRTRCNCTLSNILWWWIYNHSCNNLKSFSKSRQVHL